MFQAALTGWVAALIVLLPKLLTGHLPQINWNAPVNVLTVTFLAVAFQSSWLLTLQAGGLEKLTQLGQFKKKIGKKYFPARAIQESISGLIEDIHQISEDDHFKGWKVRAVISFLLSVFGGMAGPEGAAIEWSQGRALQTRSRSLRWSEQARRTDVASALAAGIAAAFGAPFAGLILPLELGIGGKSTTAAVAALSAMIWVRLLSSWMGLGDQSDLAGALYGLQIHRAADWFQIGLICLGSVIGALLFSNLLRLTRNQFLELFKKSSFTANSKRILVAGVGLFLFALVFPKAHVGASFLLEQTLSLRLGDAQVALIWFTSLISIVLMIASFGSAGVFWPIFAWGSSAGFLLSHWVVHADPAFATLSGLVGGSAVLGSLFGAPIAAGLISFELTQNPKVLLPCLIASFVADWLFKKMRGKTLVISQLEFHGVRFVAGRSLDILDAIEVGSAMITDHECIYDQEAVEQIHSKLLGARYPFLPVINSNEEFVGLLTVDMVEDAWRSKDPLASHSPLIKLLEAKDLLYRSGVKPPTLKTGEKLTQCVRLFETYPCLPVVSEENKVLGLLFVHQVRLAYERETIRRSLSRLIKEPAI